MPAITWLSSAWRLMLSFLLMNLPQGKHTNPLAVDMTLFFMKDFKSPITNGLVSFSLIAAKCDKEIKIWPIADIMAL